MIIYIIVSQHFLEINQTHYHLPDDDPIIGVYESLDDAQSACERIVKKFSKVLNYESKIIEPILGVIAKYGLFHGDTCMAMYTIVQYKVM